MTDDDTPEITLTNPKVFVVAGIVSIVLGLMIGIGFYITFSGLNIPFSKGLPVFLILFLTSGIIAYIPYLYRDYTMKWGWFAEEEESEDDEE